MWENTHHLLLIIGGLIKINISKEDLNLKGVVYRIIFPNNKSYIGVTTRTFKDRLSDHKESIKDGAQVIYKAFRKYGFENVKFEILAHSKTKDELFDLELFYINEFKSNHWNHGYNMTSGGEGRNNSKHSKETIAKMSGSNNHGAKINEIIAENIKIDFSNGMTSSEIMKKYNISKGIVGNIKTGRDWKHVRPDLNEIIKPKSKNNDIVNIHVPNIKQMMFDGYSNNEIAEKFNLKPATIANIRRLTVYKHILPEYNDYIKSTCTEFKRIQDEVVIKIKQLSIDGYNLREICKSIGLDYEIYSNKISQIRHLSTYKNVGSEYNEKLKELYVK